MDDICAKFTHSSTQTADRNPCLHHKLIFFLKVNDNIKFLSRMDDLHPNTMEAAAVMS